MMAATLAQARLAFAGNAFAVHGPVPLAFGTKARPINAAGTIAGEPREVSLWRIGRPFPARQHVEASKAIAGSTARSARTVAAQSGQDAGRLHMTSCRSPNGAVLFARKGVRRSRR